MERVLQVSERLFEALGKHKPAKREAEGLAGLLRGIPVEVSSHLPYDRVEADGTLETIEAVLVVRGLLGPTAVFIPLVRNLESEPPLVVS